MRVLRGVVALYVGLSVLAAAGRSVAQTHPRLAMVDAFLAVRGRQANPAQQGVPVLVQLDGLATDSRLAELESVGLRVMRRRSGSASSWRGWLSGVGSRGAIERLLSLPFIVDLRLDAPLLRAPRPLNQTAAMIGATDVWLAPQRDGLRLTGAGVTICDIDSGVDPFHPLMFHADGGAFDWIDLDGDFVFQPGVDAVAMNGATVVLRTLNVPITSFSDPTPLFGSADSSLDVGLDYLYADDNGDGVRNRGIADGFDDATPTLGERLFVIDDVDDNGRLDVGEKVFSLATPKVKAFSHGGHVYRRDVDLSELPLQEDFAHGAGATGILAGGQRGFSQLVGIAPDADLVVVDNRQPIGELAMVDFCLDEGARVVLHEYAPWYGYHLDGSSLVESLIDSSSQGGVSHINPAGNLAGSQKLYKQTVSAGQLTTVPVRVDAASPYAPFFLIGLTVLWRDEDRDLVLTLEDVAGNSAVLTQHPGDVFQGPFGSDGLEIVALREVSSRGTVRVDAYVYATGSTTVPLVAGDWSLQVLDPASASDPDLTLFAYVVDEESGWGKGIHFPDHWSEDHLVGWPGTADGGLVVGAYTGNGFGGGQSGELASYSGRGRRIDDVALMSVTAPDDPITAGVWSAYDATYITYGGTSGASPHVAGVAALLFGAEPTLSGTEVRDRIRSSALADGDVGAVPNDQWGYGKLRAYEAVLGQPRPEGAAPTIVATSASGFVSEAIAVAIAVSDVEDAPESLAVDVDWDYDGTFDERLAKAVLEVTFPVSGEYYVPVRVVDSDGMTDRTLVHISVVERPSASQGNRAHADVASPIQLYAAGDGCSLRGVAGGGQPSRGAWLVFGLGAAVWATRRIRVTATNR